MLLDVLGESCADFWRIRQNSELLGEARGILVEAPGNNATYLPIRPKLSHKPNFRNLFVCRPATYIQNLSVSLLNLQQSLPLADWQAFTPYFRIVKSAGSSVVEYLRSGGAFIAEQKA